MIKFKRKLNIVASEAHETIQMNQYDTDVELELELYASDGTFLVEPGTEVAIRGVKPDGNGVSVSGTIVTTQEKYTKEEKYTACIKVDPQMTAVAGQTRYKLVLIKDDRELNTGAFIVDVDRAALDKDALPSESVIREIVDTLDRTDEFLKASRSITKAKKEINQAMETAEEAARKSEHDRETAETAVQAVLEGVKMVNEALEQLNAAKKDAVDAVKQAAAASVETVNEALAELDKTKEAALKELYNENGNLRSFAAAAISSVESAGQKQIDEILNMKILEVTKE